MPSVNVYVCRDSIYLVFYKVNFVEIKQTSLIIMGSKRGKVREELPE